MTHSQNPQPPEKDPDFTPANNDVNWDEYSPVNKKVLIALVAMAAIAIIAGIIMALQYLGSGEAAGLSYPLLQLNW